MMAHQIINIPRFTILLGLCCFIVSCYYDVEEELYPNSPCDVSNVTYGVTVSEILQNKGCVSCHNNATASGGVILDQYEQVKIVADNGRLLGAIRHENGYAPMPQSQPKIPQCDIDRISAWINAGAPNN